MMEDNKYTAHKDTGDSLSGMPLGRKVDIVTRYTPSLLVAVSRSDLREGMMLDTENLPFEGADLWTAFELDWLDRDGKPEVGILQLTVPCESASIIESKSLKLYLLSFSQTKFSSAYDVARTLEADLSVTAGATVLVDLQSLSQSLQQGVKSFPGESLDSLPVECETYLPSASLLEMQYGLEEVNETLYCNLLRTLCPVTGQPDTGSVQISYHGRRINRESLLRYIVSYREHSGFHEQCVERMFLDIQDACKPTELTVYACYNRRGGIDINPYRSTQPGIPPHIRLVRQ